jgi:hypothetical protein
MRKLLSVGLALALATTAVPVTLQSAGAHPKPYAHSHKKGKVAAGVAAGIVGGLIIGGAIANSNRNRNREHCHRSYCHTHNYVGDHSHERTPVYVEPEADYGNDHVNWCYNRYRSYREYDNTYQPYNGGRRQCNSPFG